MFSKEYDILIDKVKEIPGISKKQATIIVNYLINQNIQNKNIRKEIDSLISSIEQITECSKCGSYMFDNKCSICDSNARENILMIIENTNQLAKYEQHQIFKGKYFKIPLLFNKKFERINTNYNCEDLVEYAKEFDEIIIALSPTAEGIIMTNFVFDKIKKVIPKAKISKLAIGIPLGSSIDYMDHLTISYAIKNRKGIE